MRNKKIALVCSGGVVKAASWHLGVALALKELGFSFSKKKDENDLYISTLVGSSAGAFISAYLASGHSPEELINANLSRTKKNFRPIQYKDIFCLKKPHSPKFSIQNSFENFPRHLKLLFNPLNNISGLFSTYGISKYIKEYILHTNSFNELESDLFLVSTPLDKSHKVIFGKKKIKHSLEEDHIIYRTNIPISEATAASMTLPPFFAPYPIKSENGEIEYYIDGEIRDTLSTHVAIDNKCDFVISSWTHTPYQLQEKVGSLVQMGIPAICVQSIYLLIQSKILSSRRRTKRTKNLIDSIFKYLKSEKISQKIIDKVIYIISKELNYIDNITLIDIFPKNNNHKLFLSSFFSLNPETNLYAIKMGHRRTLEVFKNKEW